MLNLDTKRAEAQNKPLPVMLGGEQFDLPPKIPLESLELMGEAKFRKGFAVLFGEDPDAVPPGGKVTARFFSHRPDSSDLEQIMGLYGGPESEASPISSMNGGRPPKRTGKGTTTAT